MGARGWEGGRHRIKSRLQALNCQHRAWCKAQTHEPWDHDLSRSQTLNQLSHPGAPLPTILTSVRIIFSSTHTRLIYVSSDPCQINLVTDFVWLQCWIAYIEAFFVSVIHWSCRMDIHNFKKLEQIPFATPQLRNEIWSGVPGWLSQLSIWLLISAQFMISWFVGLSPTSGFTLTERSLLGILSPSLSAPFTHSCSLSLSQNKLN